MENRRDDKASNLIILEEAASLALARLLEAQDDQMNQNIIAHLQNQYDLIQEQLELELTLNYSFDMTSSTNIISSKLSQYPAANKAQSRAEPLHIFSQEESLRINEHYETLPPDLKLLFDEALLDSAITLDKINNPVFLKGEGYVYDLSSMQEMLKHKREANYPRNPSKKFTQNEIIPCNTLIIAMMQILNIIEGHFSSAKPVEANQFMMQIPQHTPANISPEMIKIIEAYYLHGIESKHRILFDAICRDSFTNMIMQKPVFLPDGYVYDHNTALMLLESANLNGQDSAICPKMNIAFKKEDITPCPLAIAVLEQLKNNIQTKYTAIQNQESNEPKQLQRFGYIQ